jgi:hypothetical protein
MKKMDEKKNPLGNFFKLDGLGRKGFSNKMVTIATSPTQEGE